jgi:hypothetical protein
MSVETDNAEVTAMPAMTAICPQDIDPPKDKIMKILGDQIVSLFHNQKEESYISVRDEDGIDTTYSVYSERCKQVVRKAYYRAEGKGLDKLRLDQTLATLASIAVFDGNQAEVYLRVAPTESNGVELDLGDDTVNCLRIEPHKKIKHTAPKKCFLRPNGSQPITFQRGKACFSRIWEFVNVTEGDDRALLAG